MYLFTWAFETKYCCTSVDGQEHTMKPPNSQQSSCLCLHIAGIIGRSPQAQVCSLVLRPRWCLGWRVTGYHGVWRLPVLLQCSGRSLQAPGLESSQSMEALPSLLSQSEKTLKWGSFTPGSWQRSQVSAGPSLDLPNAGRRSTVSARQHLSRTPGFSVDLRRVMLLSRGEKIPVLT